MYPESSTANVQCTATLTVMVFRKSIILFWEGGGGGGRGGGGGGFSAFGK